MKRARRDRPGSSPRQAAPSVPLLLRSPWIEIVLVSINLVVYASVRDFQFVNWDDPLYITENPHVLGGLTWHNVTWALVTGYTPYWHPVTWLSHLVDIQLFGFDPGAHHVVNLVIHIANTLFLFAGLRWLTGAPGRSAWVAALFAGHPIHVESVAWITERKDVLSTCFLLLSIGAYAKYARHRRWSWYLGTFGCYVLALMSKPMVVTLPFALLLLDVWPLRRVDASDGLQAVRKLVLEKTPFLAAALATAIATVIIQAQVGAVASLGALPIGTRLSNALVSYVQYLWKAVWPTHLAAFYPLHPVSGWLVLAAAITLVAISIAAIRLRPRHPYLFVGWFWYLITLAPVIGLLQAGEQALADRFMYVPLVGLLTAIAWEVVELAHQWRLPAFAPAATAIAVTVVSLALARAQVATWADSVTLWQHALSVTRDNYVAHEKLGDALRDQGRLDEAWGHYQAALATAPPNSPVYGAIIRNDLGLVLIRQGRNRDAITEFAESVRLNPSFAEVRINLGNALAAEGQLAEAIEHFTATIQVEPGFAEAQVGLGNALLKQGKAAEAAVHYREALKLKPNLSQAEGGLGSALAMQGHDDQAVPHYLEALRLDPNSASTHFNLAVLLLKQGKTAEARQHLQSALSIDPNFQPAREALRNIDKRD